ncbi:MAG: ACT domain-containing protein [Tissierellia bacterium]|nr:ACT domain-containing protein [Tissierellia bacterium]
MKAVISVVGKDRIGIVYEATELLVKYKLNILDINQTLMEGFFTMIMLVDLSAMTVSFDELVDGFDELGKKRGISIRVQHEDIFDAMHNI